MLLPYSSDVFKRHRPWFAYLLFPVFVIMIFNIFREGYYPDVGFINYEGFLVGIGLGAVAAGLIILTLIIWTCFTMWTFGLALCTIIGNILYVLSLVVIAGLGFSVCLLWGMDDPPIWISSWIISGIVGMCLMLMPNNAVDCFIVIPPWRSYSVNSLWVYITWLIVDAVICAFSGWWAALVLHPISFVLGFLLGWVLSKLRFIADDEDSYTFWQWIKGVTVSETAWEDSWSERKKKKAEAEDKENSKSALPPPKKISVSAKTENKPEAANSIGVLCNCGKVLHVPAHAAGKRVRCSACSHVLSIPKTQ